MLIGRSLNMHGIAKVRANRMTSNNVFEYARFWNITRDDVHCLNRHYSRVKSIIDFFIGKFEQGNQVLMLTFGSEKCRISRFLYIKSLAITW
jgi:hypothetical protein